MRQSVMRGQLEEISNDKNLDESLRDILIQLNEAGYCTVGSCSGYRWEHCDGGMCCCDFKPFVSIMAYNWEAKKLVSRLKQDLLGTYWDVKFHSYPALLVRDDRRQVLNYSHGVYYEEKYDLYFSVIWLAYKKNISDERIKRGWDILLSRLVGD